MHVAFAQSNSAGHAKTWTLGLKLRDPYVLMSLEAFKARLKQTFEPPRVEFRARSELLKLKQGKRDVHAYHQLIRLLASCITNNPVHEHTMITVFVQGFTTVGNVAILDMLSGLDSDALLSTIAKFI